MYGFTHVHTCGTVPDLTVYTQIFSRIALWAGKFSKIFARCARRQIFIQILENPQLPQVMVWWEKRHIQLDPAGYLRRAGSPAARPHELTYLPPERFGLACGSPAAYLLTPQRFGRPGAARLLTYPLPSTPTCHT